MLAPEPPLQYGCEQAVNDFFKGHPEYLKALHRSSHYKGRSNQVARGMCKRAKQIQGHQGPSVDWSNPDKHLISITQGYFVRQCMNEYGDPETGDGKKECTALFNLYLNTQAKR